MPPPVAFALSASSSPAPHVSKPTLRLNWVALPPEPFPLVLAAVVAGVAVPLSSVALVQSDWSAGVELSLADTPPSASVLMLPSTAPSPARALRPRSSSSAGWCLRMLCRAGGDPTGLEMGDCAPMDDDE